MCVFGGSKNLLYPPKIVSVCFCGSKIFFILPQNCKTESAKFHEILTTVGVGRGLKTFLYPPEIVSVYVFGESKNFSILLQNFKTESAKFHEILTSVCVGGCKTFLYP